MMLRKVLEEMLNKNILLRGFSLSFQGKLQILGKDIGTGNHCSLALGRPDLLKQNWLPNWILLKEEYTEKEEWWGLGTVLSSKNC